MSTLAGNAVIGQSGGPTAVINQSLVGCIEGLRGCDAIGRIYGAHHAVRGIVDDDLINLSEIPMNRLERIARTPASALGSSRDKPDEAYCRNIFESFERHDIRYFFYIGGNDSSDTCRIVNEVAKGQGYALRAFHVPKTIDNDLVENDHTPGFGSAARFVACALMGDSLDNRSLPGIKVDIIMGRHAGWLTAASSLARRHEDDGPHLIYVPEAAFDIDRFVADVDRVYTRLGRCVIAASEGIHDAEGTPIAVKLAENVEKDAHGNVQLSGTGALGDYLSRLIKDRLGGKLRVRADTFGYLQRSFVGCVSEVDQHEARQAARRAAELAVEGCEEGSIAIRRTSDDPYAVSYDRIELSEVAAKTRTLPQEMIVDGHDIAPDFLRYAGPLVGELPETALIGTGH
ncbi:MAG: 6-phosphofructokinase [Deltaproteobacteria bacterium]|jgi:6-phosphofructokinase 1|nr:6-phosphofructokinase [Deltaproteobacteria bacterium]